MRISERSQNTIPQRLRDRFGMNADVKAEIKPTEHEVPDLKRAASEHPVDRVYGILNGGNTDDYLDEARGR